MLSTELGIADGADASAAGAINASNDDLQTADLIHVDVDQVGSSAAGKGLIVDLGVKIPF